MKPKFFSPGNRLISLVGGALPAVLPAEVQRRAEEATARVAVGFTAELGNEIERIYLLADAAGSDMPARLEEIYARAHELRGLCGSLGHDVIGRVAEALCTYVEDAREMDRTPRANIVWLHAAALKRAHDDTDAAKAISSYLIGSLCKLRRKELDQACPPVCTCEGPPSGPAADGPDGTGQ